MVFSHNKEVQQDHGEQTNIEKKMKRGKFLGLLSGLAVAPVVVSEILKENPKPKQVKSCIEGGEVFAITENSEGEYRMWCRDDMTIALKKAHNEMAQKWLIYNK